MLGPEHSRRVRCMGLGDVPTKTFRNTRLRVSSLCSFSSGVAHPSTSSNQWQVKYNNLESTFKAHMIMKEGGTTVELACFFTLESIVSINEENMILFMNLFVKQLVMNFLVYQTKVKH